MRGRSSYRLIEQEACDGTEDREGHFIRQSVRTLANIGDHASGVRHVSVRPDGSRVVEVFSNLIETLIGKFHYFRGYAGFWQTSRFFNTGKQVNEETVIG